MLLPNAMLVLTTDQTDGLRIEFDTGDIVHLKPSGNAPEQRCYAGSNNQNQANELSIGCLKRIKSLVMSFSNNI
jgi:phosphomannomutase